MLHSNATLRYIEMEHGKAITINGQAMLNKHSTALVFHNPLARYNEH